MATAEMLIQTCREALSRHPRLRPGQKILVAMSGGVDSSVVAALLHHLGYEVVGVSMHLFPKGASASAEAGRCCTLDDFQDARRVAWKIGIPHYIKNYEATFDSFVIEPFVQSYLAGETPSPCILCNQHLKFGSLFQLAKTIGNDAMVATGHYAQIQWGGERFHLRKGADPGKDQSYFLFPMTQASLQSCLFPLGHLVKAEVRALADHFGLHLAQKSESQEICFVGNRHYSDIVAERTGRSPGAGDIRHRDGRLLGHHDGYWKFTVGQRKGLHVSYATPLYVLSVDPETAQVTVGGAEDLGTKHFLVRDPIWCTGGTPSPRKAHIKIRSRSLEVGGLLRPLSDGRVDVNLETPQFAVTPGQAAVFYEGDEVLGGGWILRSR